MKKVTAKTMSGLSLAVMLILTSLPLPVSGQSGKGAKLEGTWRAEITARNCQNGDPLGTFQGLGTYLHGGQSINTGGRFSPALLSTGQGVWEHTGGRNFTNTVLFFRFSPDGTFAGTQRLTRVIELSANFDEFTATDSIENLDPNDNVVSRGCATAEGHRLQ